MESVPLFEFFCVPVFVVVLLSSLVPAPLNRYIAVVIFILASFTDYLDGHIARKYNLVTNFGKFMDPLADKLLVMSALVAFIPVADVPVWVVVVILAREFMVTSLRLIAAGKGVVIAADKWGKIKTISQMIWLNYTLLMLWLFPEAGWAYTVFVVLMGIVVATTVLSGANYMLKNKELYSDR